jgi:hypothetical protein
MIPSRLPHGLNPGVILGIPIHYGISTLLFVLLLTADREPFSTVFVDARTIGWVVRDGTVIDGAALNATTGSSTVSVWKGTAFVCNATGSTRGGIVVRNSAAVKVDIAAMYQRLTNPDGNITVIVESTRFETTSSLLIVGPNSQSPPPKVPRVEVFIRITNCTFDNSLLALVNLLDVYVGRWCVLIEGNLLTRTTLSPIPLPIQTGRSMFDTFSSATDVSVSMVLGSVTLPDSKSSFIMRRNTLVSGNWQPDILRCPAFFRYTYGVATVGLLWAKNGSQFLFQDNTVNVSTMPMNGSCNSRAITIAFGDATGSVKIERSASYVVSGNSLLGFATSALQGALAYGYYINSFEVREQSQFVIVNNSIEANSVSRGDATADGSNGWAVSLSLGSCTDGSLVQLSSNALVTTSVSGASIWTFGVKLGEPSLTSTFTNQSQLIFSFNRVFTSVYTSADLSTTFATGGGVETGRTVLELGTSVVFASNRFTILANTEFGRAGQLQNIPLLFNSYTARNDCLVQVSENKVLALSSGSTFYITTYCLQMQMLWFESNATFLVSDNVVDLNTTVPGPGTGQALVVTAPSFGGSIVFFSNRSQFLLVRNTFVSNTTSGGPSQSSAFSITSTKAPFFVVAAQSTFLIQDNVFTFDAYSSASIAQQFAIRLGGNLHNITEASTLTFRRNTFLLSARSDSTSQPARIWGFSVSQSFSVSYRSAVLLEGNQLWATAVNRADTGASCHGQIFCYPIQTPNTTVSYDSSVIFTDEICNATAISYDCQGYTSGFHHGGNGNISVLHNSRWIARNVTFNFYAAGKRAQTESYFMQFGGYGIYIQNSSQMLILGNRASQFLTTATGSTNIWTMGYAIFMAAATVVVTNSSAWIIGGLELNITCRGASATQNSRAALLWWNANLTVETNSRFFGREQYH